ncbi:MAG: sugar phosphate isomerase/epimerase [Rubellimicrobium sp.]|nr:sugar phosphate isomerase/epimerase [Rubellimicrobium sp.]
MPDPIRTGIFAKTFVGHDPLTVLQAASAAGYASVQYNMACSGLPPMPDAISQATARAIAAAAQDTGLTIAALSGTWNMIHPDPAIRAAGQRRLAVLAEAAPLIGTDLITLCTGTRDADDQWRAHPDNATPAAWADLLTEMEQAVTLAESHGLRLGIEPELANVVSSAGKARDLLDTLQSEALCIVLDPANLFETEPDHTDIIARAIDLLAGRIGMAHAKDRAPDGRFTAAGTGVVDFPAFLARLRDAGFTGDLITHGLIADEAPEVARFLKTLTE